MRSSIWTGLAALLITIVAVVWAAEPSDGSMNQARPATGTLSTEMDKTSYAVGVQIGKSLNGADVDLDAMMKGIRDQMAGGELALSETECQSRLQAFGQMMRQKQMAQRNALSQKNVEEGKAFLEVNAKKEGIVVTDSGLQYQIITQGTGEKPTAQDTVSVHYRGTFIDGTEFDSSYKRGKPAQFPLTGVIKGWTEGLQLLNEGGKMKLFVPSDLAYGPNGRGNIGPSKTLIFEVELLEINTEKTPAPR